MIPQPFQDDVDQLCQERSAFAACSLLVRLKNLSTVYYTAGKLCTSLDRTSVLFQFLS